MILSKFLNLLDSKNKQICIGWNLEKLKLTIYGRFPNPWFLFCLYTASAYWKNFIRAQIKNSAAVSVYSFQECDFLSVLLEVMKTPII